MEEIGVVGNISRDIATYPDGRCTETLGGVALYVALAATNAGLRAAPISVIGTDLAWIHDDPRLTALDLAYVKTGPGGSCTFRLTYDDSGQLTRTRTTAGVATGLTDHALSSLGSHGTFHVCCRRPLDPAPVLGRLVSTGTPFSIDFHLASARTLMATALPFLPYASTVFVNVAEFAVLSRATDHRRIQTIVITDGPHTATVLRKGREVASALPPVTSVTEVTGAGDTLAGTFVAASARGLDHRSALRKAVDAASAAVAIPRLALPAPGDKDATLLRRTPAVRRSRPRPRRVCRGSGRRRRRRRQRVLAVLRHR